MEWVSALRVPRATRVPDVLSFVLESEDRSPLPAPLAGQFLVFKLELDKNSAPMLRSYSMSGPQGAGTYRVSVKRADGVGSHYFHESIQVGDVLQVSAPRGSFILAASQTGRFAERGYRGDACARDAARVGRQCRRCRARNMVVLWSPEWPRAFLL